MIWQHALMLGAAGFLLFLAVVCFLMAFIKAKGHKRDIAKFDARAGRDVWRDHRGITK